MRLDDVLLMLRDALRRYHKTPKRLEIEPELLEEIEWFLTKYREHVNYNVERPNPKAPPNREKKDDSAFWGTSSAEAQHRRQYEGSFSFEEIYRRASEHMNQQKSQWEKANFYSYAEADAAQAERMWKAAFGPDDLKPKPKKERQKKPWPEVLGVRPTATRMEIMKAYRSLAMRFHPDRKPEGNSEKMQEINVAKDEALGDTV